MVSAIVEKVQPIGEPEHLVHLRLERSVVERGVHERRALLGGRVEVDTIDRLEHEIAHDFDHLEEALATRRRVGQQLLHFAKVLDNEQLHLYGGVIEVARLEVEHERHVQIGQLEQVRLDAEAS